MEDTCDRRGKPLAPKTQAKAKLPPTSTPSTNGTSHSPEQSPIDSPESPPEPTIELNLIEKNLTEDKEEGENNACAQPAPSSTVRIQARNGASNERFYQSPHIDKTHFDPVTGFVPPGKGATAVEIYYERFDICHNDERLTSPMEDDLIRHCPDLERLREAVTAYSRAGFKTLRNIKLILDWYREPSRYQRDNPTSVLSGNGRASPADKSQANANELRVMLKAQGKEAILHG